MMIVKATDFYGEVFCGQDYSLHVLFDPKGNKIKKHTHDDWDESWYILSGVYVITIDCVKTEVTTGDLITVRRKVIHSIESLEDSKRIAIFKDGININYEN